MFADPLFLCLTLPVFAGLALRWLRPAHRRFAVPFSGYSWLPVSCHKGGATPRASLLLKTIALLCLVLIAAGIGSADRPRRALPRPALVLVLDVSSSMTADDFSPTNRLEEAKKRLREFLAAHQDAEAGLVQFAASPRLLAPVTGDLATLALALQRVQPAGAEEDGTAIGSGIASAVSRLRNGPWGERRILLVTDGVSNRGSLAPLDAARLASIFGIRIDAIGIGTDAVSRLWVPNPGGGQTEVEARIDIDDQTLESVTAETGGSYQRVRNSVELSRALDSLKIGRIAPTIVDPSEKGREWVRLLALAALCSLGTGLVLSDLAFSVLPG
jgi:Ca-activated chloride channel family protein